MWRFYGYYGGLNVVGNLHQYGQFADDSSFDLVPAWQNKLQAMAYEDAIYTRNSHYSYEIKNNNLIDKNNSTKISNETIKLLNIQRDIMIKQLIRFPNLYDDKNHNLLELSTRAHRLIFRMCESYELWCRETNQKQLIQLDVLD